MNGAFTVSNSFCSLLVTTKNSNYGRCRYATTDDMPSSEKMLTGNGCLIKVLKRMIKTFWCITMKANNASSLTAPMFQSMLKLWLFPAASALTDTPELAEFKIQFITFLKFRFRVLFRRHSQIKLSKYGKNR